MKRETQPKTKSKSEGEIRLYQWFPFLLAIPVSLLFFFSNAGKWGVNENNTVYGYTHNALFNFDISLPFWIVQWIVFLIFVGSVIALCVMWPNEWVMAITMTMTVLGLIGTFAFALMTSEDSYGEKVSALIDNGVPDKYDTSIPLKFGNSKDLANNELLFSVVLKEEIDKTSYDDPYVDSMFNKDSGKDSEYNDMVDKLKDRYYKILSKDGKYYLASIDSDSKAPSDTVIHKQELTEKQVKGLSSTLEEFKF